MAFKYGQSKIDGFIEQIEKWRELQEIEQLCTYVGHFTADRLTAEERAEIAPDLIDNELIGYDRAGLLSPERLRELFEADDWGQAWEMFDSEKTEYFEQDSGKIEAFTAVLDLLRGEPELEPELEPEFDPLRELSLARTALNDPAGLPNGKLEDTDDLSERMSYAIDRIDGVMGSLYFEPGAQESDEMQAARVATTLGRLLAAVTDELDSAGVGGDGEPFEALNEAAARHLRDAGDAIDLAIEALE